MSAIVLSKPIQWSQLLGRQDLLDRKAKVDTERVETALDIHYNRIQRRNL